ncbi:MAG: lipopolysaccharide assembly protein LapA domain-containing protein [Desulfobacterales bacterium]
MNKAKVIFWVIVLGFISLLIFQNQDVFLREESLRLNVLLGKYTTTALPVAVYVISFFVSGLLIAYFFSLHARFKSNQAVKDLKSKLQRQTDTIARMGEEVTALKAALEEKNAALHAQQGEPAEPGQDEPVKEPPTEGGE